MDHESIKWSALLLVLPAFAAAQVVDLVFETTELEFIVEDLGGAAESLAFSETPTEVHIELAADVLFAFDSAEIQPTAEAALGQAADVIEQYGDTRVEIDGHTDARGADDYNLRLSEQRANAVRDWFVTKGGIQPGRFETRGLGEASPVAPNANPDGSDNPEGRQQNRRVEIRVQKQ